MGATKKSVFTDRQNRLAEIAKALGHPARIAIVDHLMQVESCICGEIVDELPLAQPTISQHLRELKSAGLIEGTVEGNAVCYCIDTNGADELLSFLNTFTSLSSNNTTCC